MAIAKVGSLTGAQWELARAIHGEYVADGLCTDPADRPAAEAAISSIYELIEYKPPQFIWCQSPAAARLVIRMLDSDSAEQRARTVGESVQRWLDVKFAYSFERTIKRALTGALRRELLSELSLRLGGGWAWTPLLLSWAADQDVLSRPLPDLLSDPLGEAVRKSFDGIRWPPPVRGPRTHPPAEWLKDHWRRGGGQFESRLAEFDVPRRLGLVTYDEQASERLDLMCTLTRSCGEWMAYEHICLITERPAEISAEAPAAWGQLRLHCPDGPAITFRDGWSVHAWHGTHVSPTLIEGGWDIAAIMAERNGEIRRCAIEKLGWNQFEQHLIPLASAPDPGNPGQVLTLCELPAAIRNTYLGSLLLLLCSNGTPEADGTRRRFALPVPPHHTDPVAAAAELYGWTRDEYAALARRA